MRRQVRGREKKNKLDGRYPLTAPPSRLPAHFEPRIVFPPLAHIAQHVGGAADLLGPVRDLRAREPQPVVVVAIRVRGDARTAGRAQDLLVRGCGRDVEKGVEFPHRGGGEVRGEVLRVNVGGFVRGGVE